MNAGEKARIHIEVINTSEQHLEGVLAEVRVLGAEFYTNPYYGIPGFPSFKAGFAGNAAPDAAPVASVHVHVLRIGELAPGETSGEQAMTLFGDDPGSCSVFVNLKARVIPIGVAQPATSRTFQVSVS